MKIVDINQRRKSQLLFDEVRGLLAGEMNVRAESIDLLADILRTDTRRGIAAIADTIQKLRGGRSGAVLVEAVAGGPNRDNTLPILNIVGNQYPQLNVSMKRDALGALMDLYLDKINYIYAAEHLKGITEPILAADIVINRPLYRPDWSDIDRFLGTNPDWPTLYKEFEKSGAPFWFMCAVFSINYRASTAAANRRKIQQACPDYVNATLEASAIIVRHNAQIEVDKGRAETLDGALFTEVQHCAREYQAWLVDTAKKCSGTYLGETRA